MTRCACLGGPLDATTSNGIALLGCALHDKWERVLPHHPSDKEKIAPTSLELRSEGNRLSKEEMLSRLRAYADVCGGSLQSDDMYREKRPAGLPSLYSFRIRFGSWPNALIAAKLTPRPRKSGMRAA